MQKTLSFLRPRNGRNATSSYGWRNDRILGARVSQQGLVFGHGTDNAWDEAVWLVLSLSQLPDEESVLSHALDSKIRQKINAVAKARIEQRVPLAYLLGQTRFAGLAFEVEPGVIVPRSPIAELIGEQFQPWLRVEPKRILDMCTGSGCIGIAAAYAFPGARVTLVDIDPQAVALAGRNIVNHQVQDRVEVVQSDLFEALSGSFDLVLCNPPYVSLADMAQLPPEFQAEPALALAAGVDGLSVIHRLLQDMAPFVTTDALIVLETGRSAAALARAYPQVPFIWPELAQGGEGLLLVESAALAVAGVGSNSHTVPPSS